MVVYELVAEEVGDGPVVLRNVVRNPEFLLYSLLSLFKTKSFDKGDTSEKKDYLDWTPDRKMHGGLVEVVRHIGYSACSDEPLNCKSRSHVYKVGLTERVVQDHN